MVQAKIISAIAEKSGHSEEVAEDVVAALGDAITESLKEGGVFRLERLFSLTHKDFPTRKRRNPRTGETVTVAPSRRPRIKFSKHFVESIQPKTRSKRSTTSNAIVGERSRTMPDIPPLPPELENDDEPMIWYVSKKGKLTPVPEPDLGAIATPQTPVWSEETGWKKIKDIPALGYLFMD